MLALLQLPESSQLWMKIGAIFLVVIVLGGAFLFSVALRRFLHREEERTENLSEAAPRSDNPSAFMTASMQAVIEKLKEQEKELEALHRLERERAEQTERLSEAVTRNMPAGFMLVNAAGLITTANPAAEAALGVQGLAYRRYTEALGPESALACLLTNCLVQGRTFRREEIEFTTTHRELRHLGVTISPILQGSDQVSGAICLLSDLTELTALQKQMHMRENLAALGELSAGIAHEFKNALATISGYAQMIRSEATGELVEHADRILEQTRSLTHVVTEFLKFARPLEIADEQVAMRPLIERVILDVHEAISQIQVTAEGEFGEVSGDEGLLRQAMLNLARNAAEAAAGQELGGEVVIRGSVDHAGQGAQRLSIVDNGPGIPQEDLPRIFVPFYTTKSNGTGLGLAVVQKIVVQHGGTVEARNRPEGGAEFIVWLPLRREAPQTVDSAAGGIYT